MADNEKIQSNDFSETTNDESKEINTDTEIEDVQYSESEDTSSEVTHNHSEPECTSVASDNEDSSNDELNDDELNDDELNDDEFNDDEFEEDDDYTEDATDSNEESSADISEVSASLHEPEEISQYESVNKNNESRNITNYIGTLLLKLFNTEDKKLKKNALLIFSVILFVILVLTDIIPLLPNSYHRSYVGNVYTLGETRNCDYDKLGKNILYVGGGAMCVFGPDMDLEYRKEIHTGIPYIKTNSDNAIIYFKNSNEYIVAQSNDVSEYTSDAVICSAYISTDGYYSVVTDAIAGHNSCVTAYNPNGDFIYEWFTNYDVVESAVSHSGTNMLASVVEVKNSLVSSKLIFFDLSKSDPIAEIELEGEMFFEIYSTNNGKFIALGDNKTIAYTPNGKKIWQVDYTDKNLKTYDISDDGTIAFVFDRYTSSQSESLLETYDFNGKHNGTYTSEKNIKKVSANNSHCLLSLENETILMTDRCKSKKSKTLNINFDRAILYDNYNFGFAIHDGISEIISVAH